MATQVRPEPGRAGTGQPQEEKVLTVLEHLQELRQRLMIAAGALVVATGASFVITPWFLDFIMNPAEAAYPGFRLVRTGMLGYVIPYFQISLTLGLIIAMPVIVYQALMFVLPGLTPQEKRFVLPAMFGITGSFLVGVVFGYYVVLPPALRFLLNFGNDQTEPLITIGEYVSFVTRMVVATGVTFEMPLAIMALAKFGLVTSRKLLGWWRYTVVIAFVAAAILTPSIDPVTQSLVAGPMLALYALGILLARLVEPVRRS
ncbi:MAG TPA: twin-arginine translocase subunit TatC [Dehalococcoidia bacterium]